MYKKNTYSTEIKSTDTNKNYADMLINVYSGKISELSMMLQYMYHLNFYKDVNKDLAEDVDSIHQDDMQHMHMLSDLIKKLGGDPEYKYHPDNNYNEHKYWSADLINYQKNICDMLKSDMGLKKDGIDAYKKLIEMINDKYVKMALKDILKDEIMHYNTFEEYYKKFCISYRTSNTDDDNNSYEMNIMDTLNEHDIMGMNMDMDIDLDMDLDVDMNMDMDVDMNMMDMPEYPELVSSENLYMPDEHNENLICEKGKHFLTKTGECGYDCEFGCGCNTDCKSCGKTEKTYVSPVSYDDDNNLINFRTCRPKLRRRY
ncbi:MAG: hypothetical protein A2Y24_03510 [Clostridiales bacterium GWE2_32_10]|nr:MAG: hypothetical protein A2Y24_03510 [Clostridiales bacterium GWE2_32_10]HBY19767.1 hypothetical protein [Clostridiales bacterium]